jgi:hypothetical protein
MPRTGATFLLNNKNQLLWPNTSINRQLYEKIQEDARQTFRLAGAGLIQLCNVADDYVKSLCRNFL